MTEEVKTEEQQKPDVMIDLHLFLDEVNLILHSLGQMQYNQVAGLVEKLKAQAIPQLPKEETKE